MLDTEVGSGDMDDPAQVGEQAFEGLMNGDERAGAGSLGSKVQGKLGRLIPDWVKAKLHGSMAEPGSAD